MPDSYVQLTEQQKYINMYKVLSELAPMQKNCLIILENYVHILYLSCGVVKELITMLIEEGVSVLNSVQIGLVGMDLKEYVPEKLYYKQ